MGVSWKLGRVAGIDVFVHPTFLILLFTPIVTEGGPMGLALLLAGFGCLLLHELGHALTARRFGIGTRNITLYPIGGVALLNQIPRSPGAELLIALAGPAVNVVIAAGLVGLDLLGVFGASGLGAFATNLVLFNVGLALFNLIPAFPMDGGRVFRALLSGWLGRLRATQVAVTLGRVLAVVFGVYSLTQGMWLQTFLAAYIFMVAGLELASVAAEERRDRRDRDDSGVWVAPPGFRWVERGRGVWQLAPILVESPRRGGY